MRASEGEGLDEGEAVVTGCDVEAVDGLASSKREGG
jgi:hypothetical protein